MIICSGYINYETPGVSQTPALCIKWHYNRKIINDPILIAKAIASQASPFGLRSARANTVDIRHFTTTHHVFTTKNDYIIWCRLCGLSIRSRSWWRILGDFRKAVPVPPECSHQVYDVLHGRGHSAHGAIWTVIDTARMYPSVYTWHAYPVAASIPIKMRARLRKVNKANNTRHGPDTC